MSRKLITMVLAAVFALGISGVTYAADAPAVATDKAAEAAKAATDKAADATKAAAETPKKKKVEGC